MRIRRIVAAVSLASLAVLIAAEQDTVFRVDVRLVRLLATVKSNTGDLAGDLTKDDFTVFDSGVQQEIAVFERSTQSPLSIALLVDTSASAAVKLKEETQSMLRFLDALFREGHQDDAVTLYSFNHDVTLESSYTRRVKRIAKELRSLKAEAGTSLYDAIFFASRSLRRRDSRRVIVVVTDGADTTSVKNFQGALEEAHNTDAIIYGLMVLPVSSDAGRHIAGENALISLCAGTGGRVFAASLGEMLDTAFDDILRDLRTQYLIGYYPRGLPHSTERFRQIQVTLARPDLRVLTRTGYYGGDRDVPPTTRKQEGPVRKPRHQE